MSKKRLYHDSYLEFGFTCLVKNGQEHPQCVICSKCLGSGSMKPFQLRQHLKKNHPELQNKTREYFALREKAVKRARLDATGDLQTQSSAIVKASYEVAFQVAKTKKPHTIAEDLVKPCLLACTKLVLGESACEKMKKISMSNDTIRSRIDDLSKDMQERLLVNIRESPVFSIQLDESTDVANLSQLMVFVRYVRDRAIEEDFLFCQPVTLTTQAADIMQLLSEFFEENHLDWNRMVGVCTDGAPAMLGARSGLVALIKKKNPLIQCTHCVLHREALASKTLPEALKQSLSAVIKAVNYVKGSALNTRLFRRLCEDLEAGHSVLLFHTQVRWLSKGNMLQRVFDLFDEILLFFEEQGKIALLNEWKADNFHLRLAYLTDIFGSLNELNTKMQGKNMNILVQDDKIRGFVAKLDLWKRRVQRGNLASFSAISTCLGDGNLPEDVVQDITSHLSNLKTDFLRYFPHVREDVMPIHEMIRNPFTCNAETVHDGYQEELLDLQADGCAKDAFKTLDLETFWMSSPYEKVAKIARDVLVQFSTTYLCEVGFSALVSVKTKVRNKLQVEASLRCALSNTKPDIEKLTRKKQAQVSH